MKDVETTCPRFMTMLTICRISQHRRSIAVLSILSKHTHTHTCLCQFPSGRPASAHCTAYSNPPPEMQSSIATNNVFMYACFYLLLDTQIFHPTNKYCQICHHSARLLSLPLSLSALCTLSLSLSLFLSLPSTTITSCSMSLMHRVST